MSTEVDQRVVSMQFDNAQFERGVQQTLQSLNRLDESIGQVASQNSNSFNGLISALTNVDRKISSGILPTMEIVSNKFSIWGVIADQTLRNITNTIENFASKTLHGLFQVGPGLNEYEIKMGSIQTIMNGTGASIEEVGKQLDELNTYADKTIYSFRNMTDNIGKFTNYGIKLDTAVAAMKGIANEAAASGANTMQASRAMYNFAQALSSGYVKYIDWRSIELSMMGTKEFKDALLETATALGTVTKQGDAYITTTKNANGNVSNLFNAQKGFNESLQYQWMTNDVLMQALEFYATDIRELNAAEKEEYETKLKSLGFTDEQISKFEELGIKANKAATEIKTFSMLVDTVVEAIGSGWAKTFEIIFGNFEEAKALWTGMGKYLEMFINNFSNARNKILEEWKKGGGRTKLIESFVNVLNGILSVVYPIIDAFKQVFGIIDSKKLVGATEALADFTSHLRLSRDQMMALRDTAIIVFSVLKSVFEVLGKYGKEIIGAYLIITVLQSIATVASGGLGLGVVFALIKMIIALGIGAKLLGVKIDIEAIKDVIDGLITSLINFKDRVVSGIIDLKNKVVNTIVSIPTMIGNAITGAFNGVLDFIGNLNKTIINFVTDIPKYIGTLVDTLKHIYDRLGGVGGILQFSLMVPNLVKFIKIIQDTMKVLKPFELIRDIFDDLERIAISVDLKAIINALSTLMIAFTILTYMKSENVSAAVGAVVLLLSGIAAMLYGFKEIARDVEPKGVLALSAAIASLAAVIIELGASFVVIGTILAVITAIVGDVNRAFVLMLYPLGLMIAAFFIANAGIAALSLVLQMLAESFKEISLGTLALLEMSVALAAFGVGLGILLGVLTLTMAIISILPSEGIVEKTTAFAKLIITLAAALSVLSVVSGFSGVFKLLAMTPMLLAFAIAIGIVSLALKNISDLGLEQIVVFFASFTASVAALTVVFSAFWMAALVSLPVLAMISVTVLASGVAFITMAAGVRIALDGVTRFVDALSTFVPVMQNFIAFIISVSDNAAGIAKSALAIGLLGANLMVLGAGLGVLSLGGTFAGFVLNSVSKGLKKFGEALKVVGNGIVVLATSIKTATDTLGQTGLIINMVNWGMHLVDNFAAGIEKGGAAVEKAVLGIIGIVKDYLEHTSPSKGPLANFAEMIWGEHATENFANGMLSATDSVEDATTSLCTTISNKLHDFLPTMGEWGTALGDILGLNAKKSIKSNFKDIAEALSVIKDNPLLTQSAKSKASEDVKDMLPFKESDVNKWIQTGKKLELQGSSTLMGAGKFAKDIENEKKVKEFEKKNGIKIEPDTYLDVNDFLPQLNVDDVTKTIDELTNAFSGLTDEEAEALKGSDSELKKSAERAQIHAKYLEYSNKVATQFNETYTDLNSTLGNTAPTIDAQNAIKLLADNLYQASLTGNETEEELEEIAHNTEKAFVTMYDNIKSKAKESFSFFKEYDRGLKDIVDSKKLLSNVETQSITMREMTEMWEMGALAGFDSDLLKSLIEQGTEGMAQFRSLLKLNQNDLTNYMTALSQKDTVAETIATTGMSALALNLQSDKIRQAYKQRQDFVKRSRKLVDDWKKIENNGSITSITSYNTIANGIAELAAEYGASIEEIKEAGESLTDDTQIDYFDKLRQAYFSWVETYNTESTRMTDSLGKFTTSFEKLDKDTLNKSGVTTESITKNLRRRQKATELWLNNLNTLSARGFDKDKLAEFVEAGVESSYKYVKVLANATDDELAEINAYLYAGRQRTKQAAESYGSTVANNVVSGIDTTLTGYFESLRDTVGTKFTFNDLAKTAGLEFGAIGEAMGAGLVSGLDSKTDDITTAASTAIEGVNAVTEEHLNEEKGYSHSANLMQGILNGINDYKDPVVNAMTDVCTSVTNVIPEVWDEHSPSKLTEKFAKFFMLGFVGGFDKYGVEAVDSVQNDLLDPIVETIREALYTAYDILTSDFNLNPTITPVLDLSNIQNGKVLLGSLMSNTGFQVDANIGEINPPMTNMQAMLASMGPNAPSQNNSNTIVNKFDDSKIVGELSALRSDINNLNDRMTNLQVVMDSGALVGSIGSKMDDELGNIYRRKNRG